MSNAIVLAFLIVSFVSYFLTVLFFKIHNKVGLVDIPDERRVHKKITPRGGGLAIYFSFLIGVILFFPVISNNLLWFLIGSLVLIGIGIYDDLFNSNPFVKLFFQIIAAFLVVYYGDVYFTELYLPFNIYLQFSNIMGIVFSMLWIIFLINAINLIDGIDGLASGYTLIFFATIAISSIIVNDPFSLLFALIMIASISGFWIQNFPPARIFLGDVGSMFLGFSVGFISLLGFKNITFVSVIVPFILLWIPIVDVFSAIVRRKLNKQSFKTPDKKHLHHSILKLFKGNQKKAVMYFYFIFTLFAIASIVYIIYPIIGILIVIGATTNLFFIVYRFDMLGIRKLRKRNGKKKKKENS